MRSSRICSSYRECFRFHRLEGRLFVGVAPPRQLHNGRSYGCGSSYHSGDEWQQLSSSVVARIHERNWHNHNKHLSRSRSTFAESSMLQGGYGQGQLMRGVSMATINVLQLLPMPTLPPSHRFAVISRSTGIYNNRGCCHGRFFGSDATNSSTPTPNPSGQHSETKSKSTTTVPKEYLAAIKSEVDDMESSPPTTSQQNPTFPRAKKTQDDFADYLKGAEVMLDGEGGLIMKSKSSAQNTMKRENVTSSSSTSQSSRPTSTVDQSASASASAILSSSNTETSLTDDDQVNKQSERQASIDNASTTTSTSYQYKFSSSDATLSDPQRHLDRRRAMEQKMQEQQAESRAATMKNVQRALAGNFIIAAAKLAAAISSGSSAMLSEFVHSVVDCGNQALLLVGLNTSKYAPDRSHPYGYGKAIYFWALVRFSTTCSFSMFSVQCSLTHSFEYM
jgi:hypothetical protein